ncbi:MAG: hypothetical protein J6V42_06805 [Clostridia bacterium]|nr:hypothetical protein [Clostridia bacterium]
MIKESNYLSKGLYSHFQIRGYLAVKQYMIIEQGGKHCLLLRFENEMKRKINTIEFTLKQIDSHKNLIKSVTVNYKDLNITPGGLYSTKAGIVLEDNCEDFIIQMRYLISDNIKYVFKKDFVTEHYDVSGYNKTQPSSKRECKMRAESIFSKKRRGYGWIAVLSFILLLLSVFALIYNI